MKYLNFICFLLLSCLLVGGCAMPANQGHMVRAGEVDQLVESANVLPDHTYYFTGPEAKPDAIIALDNSLTLGSKYWIRVDDVSNRLKEWNRSIDNSTRIRYAYEGSWIMTPDGRKVGLWYSVYRHSFVQFPDSSTIIIYAPIAPPGRREPSLRAFGWRD